MTTSSA